MVGALSVVASSVVDSHTGPCLCVDALPSTSVNLKSGGGDVALCRNSMGKKQLVRRGAMELRSPFVDSRREWRLCINRSYKKQSKDRKLVIVNELGGQYEDTFNDVKTVGFKGVGVSIIQFVLYGISAGDKFKEILQILNYFTYKAVRTVLQQLYEMNPPQYTWFYNFVATHKPGDGKRFLRSLGKEQQDLAERVMVTRLHLYGKWVKKCNHAEIYQEISDENLELMRERLMETVIWPSDDTNTEKIG